MAALLLLAAVVVGCGDDEDATDETAGLLPPASVTSPTTAAPTTSSLPETDAPAPDSGACEGVTASTDGSSLELALAIGEDLIRGDIDWPASVRNVGNEPVTLVYPTGQDADVVLEQDGEEVYRWSEGQAFTEAQRCQVLEPGARYSFELSGGRITLDDGTYEVVATLAADPAPGAFVRSVEIVEE